MKNELTQQILKDILSYDKESGLFKWVSDIGFKIKAGSVAGRTRSDGQIEIQIDGKKYKAHRLAFMYEKGFIPKGQIIHIDGNNGNNSFKNLKHKEKNFSHSGKPLTEKAIEKRRLYSRKRHHKNKDQINEKNKIYRKNNPEKYRIYCHNRRARIRDDGGKLSQGLAEKLYKLQKGKCPCCKKPLGNDYQLDHVMPIALGGSNTDDNIQLLRKECNQSKSAMHPVDFMQSKGFLF